LVLKKILWSARSMRRFGAGCNVGKLHAAHIGRPDEPVSIVHLVETFREAAHLMAKSNRFDRVAMKNIFPLVLSLIPLAAVVGACITCP